MPPKSKTPSVKKPFVLVRWLCDERVGILPLAHIKDDWTKCCPGSEVKAKYGKTYYDAEILKISVDRTLLNKVAKQLDDLEISREDLIADAEELSGNDPSERFIDSTTPDSTPTMSKKPKKASSKKRDIDLAKARAAMLKASEIFRVDNKEVSVKQSAESQSQEQLSLRKQLEEQKQMIEKLQKQLEGKMTSQSSSTNTKSSEQLPEIEEYSFSEDSLKDSPSFIHNSLKASPSSKRPKPRKGLPSSVQFLSSSPVGSISSNSSMDLSSSPVPNNSWKKSPASEQHSFESQIDDPISFELETTPKSSNSQPNKRKMFSSSSEYSDDGSIKKAKIPKIELVPGYGVCLTQRQLDEAIGSSNGSPTRLIRHLVSVFYTREELAVSSCYGNRSNSGLDRDILAACFKFVQEKHPGVSKTILVDSVNDKCANCRRKRQ